MSESLPQEENANGQASPLSLHRYAARRGVSTAAVSKAIKSGRLSASVVFDHLGDPKIGDADLADREWNANTRERADARPAESQYAVARAEQLRSATRRYAAQAELAEIDLAERRGQLISIAEARADMTAKLTEARTRLLGIPSQLAQIFPDRAAELVPLVEGLIRDALEDLANKGIEAAP